MRPTASTTTFLRLEGLALGLVCIWFYGELGQPWWLFAVLLLTPDLSMLGYLRGPKVGALAYNIVHSWALVVAMLALIQLFRADNRLLQSLPLILGAHIGLDRALGYGLKLPSGFRDTHLGRVGKGETS